MIVPEMRPSRQIGDLVPHRFINIVSMFKCTLWLRSNLILPSMRKERGEISWYDSPYPHGDPGRHLSLQGIQALLDPKLNWHMDKGLHGIERDQEGVSRISVSELRALNWFFVVSCNTTSKPEA